jgi:hypothetical protein
MKSRIALYISFLAICISSPTASIADDNRVLLVPVVEYSYCTPDSLGYELGMVGTAWAVTVRIPEGSFSGKVQAKGANFFRGPNIPRYIGKSAGPRRPPFPTTKAYTQVELAGISVDIHRIKVAYDKMMFPIEVSVNDFVVNNQQFRIPGPVNIVCTAPLP